MILVGFEMKLSWNYTSVELQEDPQSDACDALHFAVGFRTVPMMVLKIPNPWNVCHMRQSLWGSSCHHTLPPSPSLNDDVYSWTDHSVPVNVLLPFCGQMENSGLTLGVPFPFFILSSCLLTLFPSPLPPFVLDKQTQNFQSCTGVRRRRHICNIHMRITRLAEVKHGATAFRNMLPFHVST